MQRQLFKVALLLCCLAALLPGGGAARAQSGGGSLSVTVSGGPFNPDPVAIGWQTNAPASASSDTPTPPYGCTLNPRSYAWSAAGPAGASVWVTPNPADPSQATVSGIFPNPGYFTVTVYCTVTVTDSCGDTWSGTGSCPINITAVGVLKIQFSAMGRPFQDMPDPLYAPQGATVIFQALPDPHGAPWPAGFPVWSGSSGASGVGPTTSVTFNTLSTSATDYKTVVASCGNSVTGNVVVFALQGNITPLNNFPGHDPDAFGVCETALLSATIYPPDVTEYEIGGLQWVLVQGTGTLTGGAGGQGTYVNSVYEEDFELDLVISGGPFMGWAGDKKKKKTEKPTGVTFVQGTAATDGPWHQGPPVAAGDPPARPSAGFRAEIYLTPANVDFSGIQIREKGCTPDVHTGDFNVAPYNTMAHPVGKFVGVNAPGADGKGSKVAGKDTVWMFMATAGPWQASDFNWPIPWVYKKAGAADATEITMFTVDQHATLTAAGGFTTSKGGYSVTKALGDPRSMNGAPGNVGGDFTSNLE
jgi:hypothetical protein